MKFQITTLRDIYNLPTIEQVELCLDEFKVLIIQTKTADLLIINLAAKDGVVIERAVEWPEVIDWNDDGKGEVGTQYVMPDGSEFMSINCEKSK